MQATSNSFEDASVSGDHEAAPATRTADLSPATTADFDDEQPQPRQMRLAELLGSGRHGLVVRARLSGASGPLDVAVKIPSGSQTLKHEADALRKFAHDHVVKVLDGPLENGSLILELCNEGTLAQRMIHRPLSGPEAITIVEEIAKALRPMHESGWIHGDISPGNIGLRSHGGAALLDFTTAHLADGSFVDEGTAEFAGPFRQADPQLDVRSLAATMLASVDSTLAHYTEHFEQLIEDCDAGKLVSLDELVPAGPTEQHQQQPSPVQDLATSAANLASATPPSGPRTRAYGPRPGSDGPSLGPTPDTSQRLPTWLAVGAAIGIALLIASEFGFRWSGTETELQPESLRPNTTAEQTLIDANAEWDSTTAMVDIAIAIDETSRGDAGVADSGRPTSRRRFLAGRPGDIAAIADWNCDGRETLGVYRPLTSNWFVFDSWTVDATSTVTVLRNVDPDTDNELFVQHTSKGCASPLVR